MIESHTFGALQQMEYTYTSGAQRGTAALTNWRFDPSISGGGLFWDPGSHALDYKHSAFT